MDKDFCIQRRGLMMVFSSPSGAGKTAITRGLLDLEKRARLSISVTTRPCRPGEVPGQDYHFVTVDHFFQLKQEGHLLEDAKVFGHYYGTPRHPVEKALREGQDVLFDIDWQGTQMLRQCARGDVVTIFILPPTGEELERRLRHRSQDSLDTIALRMSEALAETSHWPEYDYVIVNDRLDKSIQQVHHILQSERLRRDRQIGLAEFVKILQGALRPFTLKM